jgi:hypothetical protein
LLRQIGDLALVRLKQLFQLDEPGGLLGVVVARVVVGLLGRIAVL